jgi:integrase
MSYAEKRNGKPTGVHIGEVYRKINGKPKTFRRRFTTKKDADGYELYVKLTGDEPPTLDNTQSTGAPTFAEVVVKAKAKGGPKGKWKAGRDGSLMQRLDFCVTVIGTHEIQNVTRGVLGKIVERLEKRPVAATRKQPLTPATINRYLAAAHSVLTFAHREGIMTERPPEAPYLDEASTRKERDILHVGQDEVVFNLMREAGHEVDALCCEFLLETGFRRGELLHKLAPDQITIEQVQDEDGTVVPVGVVRLHKGQTKNNKGRVAILSADLAKNIRALVATESLPDGLLLLRHFKTACEAAGYTGNLVLHSLRHTRNTRLRKAGITKEMRKQLLGHMSDEANAIYDHTDLEDHLMVAKKVEEYAGDRRKNRGAAKVVAFNKVS